MARAMEHYTKVTPGVFQAVKICLESGNSLGETAKFMKLSKDVVGYINKAETFDEYKALMYEKGEKARQMRAIKAKEAAKGKELPAQGNAQPATQPAAQPVQVSPAVVKVEAPVYMMQDLRDIKELLNGISNKLAGLYEVGERLADLWEK